MYTTGPSLTAKGQSFLSALTAVLVILVLSSVMDQLINILPIRFTQVDWRFGAAGTFLAALPMFAIETALIIGVAGLSGSRRAVRGAAVFALFMAVLAAVLLLPFLLDFVQARRQVTVDRQANFTYAALKTAGFGGLFALGFLRLGWLGMQASAKEATTGTRTKGKESCLDDER